MSQKITLLEFLEVVLRDAPLSKKCSFLNIVQKAFDPPPILFEHLSYFAGGVFDNYETDMKYM